MPSSRRALHVTDRYREKVGLLRGLGRHAIERNWPLVNAEDLDTTGAHWAEVSAAAVTEVQRGAARLSGAYVSGFVSIELHRRPRPTDVVAGDDVIGVSRPGKPLADALAGTIPGIKAAIGSGTAVDVALAAGLAQAMRNAGEDVAYTARTTLAESIRADSQVTGWRRVTSGGCGACLALTDGEIVPDDADLEVHDNCQCTAEPVVAGVGDGVQRPTGQEMFGALSQDAQNELLGPEKAQLIRDGDAPFHALVDRSPMAAIADQITEAPLEALRH